MSLGAHETPVHAQREREDAIFVTFQTLTPKADAVACALSLDLCLPRTWSFQSALLLLSQ